MQSQTWASWNVSWSLASTSLGEVPRSPFDDWISGNSENLDSTKSLPQVMGSRGLLYASAAHSIGDD